MAPARAAPRRGTAALRQLAVALLACGAPCSAAKGHGKISKDTIRQNTLDRQRGNTDCSYQSSRPRQYVAYKTAALSPEALDGDLSKPAWTEVDWTADFVDIATTTAPALRTRAKMRWDDQWLYVAAELEEPQIWATLTEHDSVIFHDNDFEVFVDANATTHYYKEFEVNAFNTTWDLCLNKPYGDGGYENSSRVFGAHGFDMEPPLRSAVKVMPAAALNDPKVPGTHWTVEIALPLRELAYNDTDVMPSEGTFWRIDFSRVEWAAKVDETTGKYHKAPSCQSCASPGVAAEDNWVWSPIGAVAMHNPERWGVLQFTEAEPGSTAPAEYTEWPARGAAMAVYYAQKAYAKDHGGAYADSIAELLRYSGEPFELCGEANTEIALGSENGKPSFTATVTPPGSDFAATVTDSRFLTVSRRPSRAD